MTMHLTLGSDLDSDVEQLADRLGLSRLRDAAVIDVDEIMQEADGRVRPPLRNTT